MPVTNRSRKALVSPSDGSRSRPLLALADQLGRIGARHERSAGEVAIAWTLRHPAVTGAIVGARSADQVDGVAGASMFRLSDDEAREIESSGAPR